MTETDDLWTAEIALASAPGPVTWSHFTDHYVMAPWKVDGGTLVRALLLPDGRRLVTASRNEGTIDVPDVRAVVSAEATLEDGELEWVGGALADLLGLSDDVTEFYNDLVPSDRVLNAAANYGLRGARLRIPPDVFEAVVAGLASQNVHFTRTFQVMDCLTRTVGHAVPYEGGIAYIFPTAGDIAARSEKELRGCGLGYRAPTLLVLATKLAAGGPDLQSLRDESDTSVVRETLTDLPGIGPFTADLVLSIGFRRPSFHLDSYTTKILNVLYGVEPDPLAMTAFVEQRFGIWKHYAMLLLTTDTHRWAVDLGIDFPIKSGASYRI
ncbi:MAG: DNA-3-methyladenine glycosylase family protein [Actinomycetota bacterium]